MKNNKNEKNEEILKQVTFTGANSDQNKFYFNENYINPSDNNKEIDIIHAVLPNDCDDNLSYFYNSTIDLIKSNIQSQSHESKTFDLEKYLIEFSEEFFQKKNFKIDDEKILYYEKDSNEESEKKVFEPHYSYYIDHDIEKFIINIESTYNPDNLNISDSNKVEGNQIVKIKYTYKITEKNDKELYKIKDNKIFSDIHYGDYELNLNIPIDKVYFDYKRENVNFSFKDGIIKIEYPIIKNYDNDNDSNDKVSLVDENSDEKERNNESDENNNSKDELSEESEGDHEG